MPGQPKHRQQRGGPVVGSFGRKRSRGSLTEFDFQEILVDFSHFYLGYATVLEATLGAV
jgi:hypothetical protein